MISASFRKQLEHAQGDHLWQQVESTLLKLIKGGRFKDRDRLPSEKELASQFGVNRHTVRQAIAGLVERGVVFKRKGGGSYLVPELIDYPIGKRTRFSTNIKLLGKVPGHTLLAAGERPIYGKVAAALKMRDGDRAVFLHLVGEADRLPISVAKTYLPASRFAGFGEIYRKTMSMTKALESFDVLDYFRDVTRCVAHIPSKEDAHHLRQLESVPVLLVEALDVDSQSHPIVYHETLYAGERVQLVFGDAKPVTFIADISV
ncbi:phosphonate metabolism transcriptional regulator PhnF (plasmid) [Bradyrhizobium sp. 62B]|uniref:phosphonate metabolism transcriptional regulator PhnF n=1 Tax=Bradyrhizobium sp. 62B TaxID=2898442 RepID=UPI0025580704|nr:phosphonate metabolism transcriptional regulator PhnF [Bradyrhizobium sp. 62B]